MTKKVKSKIKDTNLNTKFPLDDYEELQTIASNIGVGGMSLSSMVRMVLYAQLEKVRKSGNPNDFLDVLNKKIPKDK